ncbi:MAG: CHAT domain-containing protein, partial [Lewinella sp.]|nr:CHAT domain-containing protein [Lewinella sp.]
ALRIYRLAEGPSSVGVAYCYQSLGLCSQVNGAYEEALNFSHQAARIYRDQQPPDRRHLAGTYRNRANVLRRLGRFEQALAEHQRVLDLDEELEDIGAQADDYTNLGIVFGETGNWTEALAHHQQALVLWRTLPDHPVDLANAHVNLAESLEQLGQYAMARLQADTAQLILESAMGQRHALLAYTFNVQARLAYQAGRLDQALDWIQRALVANHQHFDGPSLAALPDLVGYYHYEYLLTSLRLKAELLWARYPNDEAYRRLAQAQYDWALQLLEQVRGELTQREDQLTLVRQVKDLAAAAIAHCYDLAELTGETAWLEKAFTYVEKSKANVLLGAMAANEARYFAGIPDSLLAREDQLMADIGYYKRQLAAEPDTSRRVALQQSLFTAQEAYKALLDHYETAFPFYYDLLYANEVPGVKALQFVLEPGQVMVDYFLSDSLLYAFVLSKDQFSVATSPMDPRFARELTGFRKGISRGLDRTYLEKAQALYPALFPFEIPRNCRHLILSPDGGLLLIPFEALLTAPVAGTGTDYTRLPFLIRDYAVRYTPSASLFYQSHATQSLTPEVQAAEGLLAVAPVFDEPVAGGAQVHASLAGYVVPLPYTEQEVNEITNLFAREGELARASLHEAASESLLKSGSLATSRFVHIATHGLIDEEEPDLSGLLLYPDSLAGEDGLLSVGEVYNLRLNAELVVLSACETATGKIATGEGVLGFVRAFLYAGADRLVVSLWKVADDATADLMIRFYQQLLEQPDPDHAAVLRAAKLQLIESGAFSHPRFWSAFILTEG